MANAHFSKSTKEQCQKFWRDPTDGKNKPEDYERHIERSIFIHEHLFCKHKIKLQSNLLEIGCNMGRNLNYLYQKGYKNLAGVEISQKALDYCAVLYPDLKVNLFCSAIEDIIKEFNDNKFDVVLTCAVLMHLHVDSEWVFAEMARITKQYIIAIEDDVRDYKAIFEGLGFQQVEEIVCCKFINMRDKYVARVFKKL